MGSNTHAFGQSRPIFWHLDFWPQPIILNTNGSAMVSVIGHPWVDCDTVGPHNKSYFITRLFKAVSFWRPDKVKVLYYWKLDTPFDPLNMLQSLTNFDNRLQEVSAGVGGQKGRCQASDVLEGIGGQWQVGVGLNGHGNSDLLSLLPTTNFSTMFTFTHTY